ncbi:MAG: acyl-CoA dehydrogenase family protein [Micromonosporaceae bacterium]
MIEWSDEQRQLREQLSAWCDRLSAGHAEYDRDAVFAEPAWQLVRESGVLRLPFGVRWGGRGHDLLTTMYVLEGLGHGCRNAGLNFSVATHIVSTGIALQRFGSDQLKDRHLPGVCSGDTIGAHAITEPDGGSDVFGMRGAAKPDGDHYVLDAAKCFITNGPIASRFVVYVQTEPGLGPFSLTAFLVERDTPGVTVGPDVPTMGLRTSPMSELVLDRVRVPAANVVGRVGGGFMVLDHVMKWEILCSFIINVGEMQHRLERCVRHAAERTQFGQPIGAYQSVANRIVDMKIGVETARRWLYDTAQSFHNGADVTTDIAIAKLIASEANVNSALSAIQIFGGRGYLTETGLEQGLRNAVGGTIYSGTSEIQRARIARMLGLTPSAQTVSPAATRKPAAPRPAGGATSTAASGAVPTAASGAVPTAVRDGKAGAMP